MCARFQPSAVISEEIIEIRWSVCTEPPKFSFSATGFWRGSLLAKLNNLLLIPKLKFFNHVFNHVNNLNPRRTVRTSSVPWRMIIDESDGCQKNANFGAKNKFRFTLQIEKMCFSRTSRINKNMWTNTNIRNCIHVALIFDKLWN